MSRDRSRDGGSVCNFDEVHEETHTHTTSTIESEGGQRRCTMPGSDDDRMNNRVCERNRTSAKSRHWNAYIKPNSVWTRQQIETWKVHDVITSVEKKTHETAYLTYGIRRATGRIRQDRRKAPATGTTFATCCQEGYPRAVQRRRAAGCNYVTIRKIWPWRRHHVTEEK